MMVECFSDKGDDMNDEQRSVAIDLITGLMTGIKTKIRALDADNQEMMAEELARFSTYYCDFFELDRDEVMDTLSDKVESVISTESNKNISFIHATTDETDVQEVSSKQEAIRAVNSVIDEIFGDDDVDDPDFGNFRYAIVDDNSNLLDRKMYDTFDEAEAQLDSYDNAQITEVMV